MAVSIVKYPQGRILNSTVNTATVSSSSGALFTLSSHGLTTGDYIYIYSNLSAYNGFWYVSVASSNTFRIREYATASDQAFVNSGTVYFYTSVTSHGWNSVHLPIQYVFKSTLWPVNGVDTARTITTFSNSNGYTYIVASGDIKSTGTASALEEVVLSGTSVDGIYKIINWYSDTNFVIDLAYSAANVLSSGTVQYYYLNYRIKVNIYAGLTAGHYWQASKPYVLVGTEDLVPDSNGLAVLDVSKYAKDQIEILNNDLQQDQLPNNLDAFCRIYVSYAEAYDDSNMYTVSDYVSSYTNDTTEIYATNSKLPFQNKYSGSMSKYIPTLSVQAYFLTDFARPTIFSGKYFDLSFIKEHGNAGTITYYGKTDRYLNGVLQSSVVSAITEYNQGIYRAPITVSSTEDRIDYTLMVLTSAITDAATVPGNDTTTVSIFLKAGVTPSHTYSYSITLGAPISGGDLVTVTMTYNYFDGTTSTPVSVSRTTAGTTSIGSTTLPTPTKDVYSITLYAQYDEAGAGTGSATITVVAANEYFPVTETKTIDVNKKCSDFDLYLTWLNPSGGFDYCNFTTWKTKNVDISENQKTSKNIFNTWPKSYGEFSPSIVTQTSRKSKEVISVTSQFLTQAQADALALIVSSPLVQVLTTNTVSGTIVPLQRTILISDGSLRKYRDNDKTFTVSFSFEYTDEIAVQSL